MRKYEQRLWAKGVACFCLAFLVCLPLAGCGGLSFSQIRQWRENLELEPLLEALESDDWRVRQEAAINLGNKKSPKAVAPLIVVLQDEDWRVQGEAARALGRIGDPRAVGPLEKLAQEGCNSWVCNMAKEALARINRL